MIAADCVGHWLQQARDAGADRLDAQLLVAYVLQQSRAWVIAHEDYRLSASERLRLHELLVRRLDDEPVAYLTGWREFDGLLLRVNRDVLVPRADTETLVAWAAEVVSPQLHCARPPRVLDLGTGSGAIALALKHRFPGAEVTGIDSSSAAVAVAQSNGQRLQIGVQWQVGHWFEPVRGCRFDLVVSNPPYVAPQDPHLHALRHEPARALVCADGGLADLRQIIDLAGTHLRSGGTLLLEHGWDQGDAVRQALRTAGFLEVQTRRDLGGQERCSGGVWPA